jgi:hypothetical protein
MPLLKNITAGSLIPCLDFEKVEKSNSNFELNYLVANVADCARTLENVSNMMFVIPSSSEEIFFYKYPSTSQLKVSEIKRMIGQGE